MRVIGISVDTAAVSREFAAAYGLDMPLVEDVDQKLSRQYVGVDADGYSVPGVVVIAPGGKIALRQTGEAPGDRIYAAGLLAFIDREGLAAAGTEGTAPSPLLGGYAPLERALVRIGAGAGAADATGGDGLSFTARAQVAALYPVGRYLMLGGLVRGALIDDAVVDVNAAAELRLPVLYDQGFAYARIAIGVALDVTGDDATARVGASSGLTLGVLFAIKPSFAIYLEAAASYHRFGGQDGGDAVTALRYTGGLGVGLLF